LDQATRRIYRLVGWVTGLTIIAVIVYGLATTIFTTGGVLDVGQTLVNVDFPFPPYFAKPVSYLSIALVAYWYCALNLWQERVEKWPRVWLTSLTLLGFVVAFSSAYEVMYNFMLWGAIYSVGFLRGVVNPNFIVTPFTIPWNFVFATKMFSALFVISGYSVYFLRRILLKGTPELGPVPAL
jgi:hypothetical protein